MATTAKTLMVNAATNGYDKLSRRGLDECLLAAAQSTVAANAQALTSKASQQNDLGLSERDLTECILAAIQ